MPSDAGSFQHCLFCGERVDSGFEACHRGDRPPEARVKICSFLEYQKRNAAAKTAEFVLAVTTRNPMTKTEFEEWLPHVARRCIAGLLDPEKALKDILEPCMHCGKQWEDHAQSPAGSVCADGRLYGFSLEGG